MSSPRCFWFAALFALITLPPILQAQAISLHANPGAEIPLADSAAVFTTGGSLSLGGEYALGGSLPIFAGLDLEYDLNPIKADALVHTVSASVGGGVTFEPINRLRAQAFISGGYYYSMLNDTGSIIGGGNPLVKGGLGLHYMLNPMIDLGIGVTYKNLIGLYSGMQIFLGTSFYLSGTDARKTRIETPLQIRPELLRARTPDPDKGIGIAAINLEPIFPVFRNYYDDHPIGKVVLVNQEREPISGIKATLFIKKYMDNPRQLDAPTSLAPGQRAELDLFALFNNGVMDITEGDKASAEFTLEYKVKDDRYADTRNRTVIIYNRNAMTWGDDRRAAAFVTRFDPLIQEYAKNLLSVVDGMGSEVLSKKLLMAIAAHQTFLLAGLKYSVDPKSSYADKSNQKEDVDYLQFPRQTLQRKGGDCDDLSILYSALLEAVGIETAFVTVPNHIFMAFALDVDPADIGKTFANAGDLFVRGGTVWVPVEVTEKSSGFSRAWRTGAQEWRQNEAAGALGFFPLGEAWKIYAPVQSPETTGESVTAVTLPPVKEIAESVRKEVLFFKQGEVDSQVALLMKQVDPKKGNPPVQNRIGILYARYGFMEKAEAEFRKLTSNEKSPFVPALINLGNLSFLKENYPEALRLYAKAAKLEPTNAAAHLSVAKASYALEKYDDAKEAFARVRQSDPRLADRFAFLEQQGEGSSRASSVSAMKGVVAWDE